jgi:hypothetical protein
VSFAKPKVSFAKPKINQIFFTKIEKKCKREYFTHSHTPTKTECLLVVAAPVSRRDTISGTARR